MATRRFPGGVLLVVVAVVVVVVVVVMVVMRFVMVAMVLYHCLGKLRWHATRRTLGARPKTLNPAPLQLNKTPKLKTPNPDPDVTSKP